MPRHEDGAIVFWQLKWLDGWEHGWEQLSAALFYTAPNAQRLLRFIGSAVVELRGFRTSDLRGAGRRQTFSTGFSVGGGLRRIRRTDSGPPDIGTVRLSDGSAALWVLT